MRKLMVAVCMAGVVTLAADPASARMRIRMSAPKPSPAKLAPLPQPAQAAPVAEKAGAPRGWIVATPRFSASGSATPATAAALPPEQAESLSGSTAAAALGAQDVLQQPKPASDPAAASAAVATPAVAPKPPEAKEPPRDTAEVQPVIAPELPRPNPVRLAAKPMRSAAAQPRPAVVCYWDRAGRCLP